MRGVVVSGAAGNLGRAVCARLQQEGVRVLGLVHEEAALPWETRVVDLTDEGAVERAYDHAAASLPAFDGAVHCAGGWAGAPLADTSVELFERMLAVNLRTAFLCTRAAARRIEAGAIVNVAAWGPATLSGLAGSAAYAASKAGVIALTKALAAERTDLRASCVAPGTLRTPQNARAMPDADASRWVPLEEVAEAIVRLLSTGATGEVVLLPSR